MDQKPSPVEISANPLNHMEYTTHITPLFEACVASRLLGQQALVPTLNMSPENLYLLRDLLYISQKLHQIARMIVAFPDI